MIKMRLAGRGLKSFDQRRCDSSFVANPINLLSKVVSRYAGLDY